MESLPFIEGLAPIQLLLEMAILMGTFVLLSHYPQKRGIKANKLFQATGVLVLAIAYLKFRVYPPMPFSTLAIYSVTIAIGIFVWVSSTESFWKSFREPILAVMDGKTRAARLMRALALILLPILVGILGFLSFKPPAIETPVELRTYNPAPPVSITVYPPEHFVKGRSEK